MTDYYLLTVYGPNRQGLFHRIVEIMGKINLEVFDADIMTAASNTFVLNKFVVKHKLLGNKLNKDDVDRMIKVLDQNLDQFERPLEINKSFLENKSKIFNFKNNVTITGVKNTQRKRITIETLDKPGLLIKISKIFLENAIQIHAARITTLGEKVEDTFLISSSKKDKLLDEDVIKRLSVSLQNL
jgi:[protein-PII] uridylyltransferase